MAKRCARSRASKSATGASVCCATTSSRPTSSKTSAASWGCHSAATATAGGYPLAESYQSSTQTPARASRVIGDARPLPNPKGNTSMSFELYYHPLSSYCWKALIALYEAELPFEKHLVDLQDPRERASFLELTPLGKFPLLRDKDRGRSIPESSILIEYLALNAPSAARLFARELALEVRARDRFFDLYVMEPMGKIVEDRLRPETERDPRGVAHAHARLDTSYRIAEHFLGE